MTQQASATGSVLSQGFATGRVVGPRPLSASGIGYSSGSLSGLVIDPPGSFDDFGIWDRGQPDAAMTRMLSSSDSVNNPDSWTRVWAAAAAPSRYLSGNGSGVPIWNDAAYAVAGVRWYGVPNNGYHLLDAVQMETSTNPSAIAPSVYEDARTLEINLEADRVNWALNPRFANDSNSWVVYANHVLTPITGNGPLGLTSFGRISTGVPGYLLPSPTQTTGATLTNQTLAGGGSTGLYPSLNIFPGTTSAGSPVASNDPRTASATLNLRKSATYRCSAYIRAVSGPTDGWVLAMFDQNGARVGTATSKPITITGQWARIDTSYDTNQSSAVNVGPLYTGKGSADAINIDITGILIEETILLHDYFDASTYLYDGLWEIDSTGNLGPAHASRSYYYAGRGIKRARLTSELARTLPLGLNFKLMFARDPLLTRASGTAAGGLPGSLVPA